LNARRLATLGNVVAAFAPGDARIDRVTDLAARAVDALTPRRRADLHQLLDLLWLPMHHRASGRAALASLRDAPVAKLNTGFAALKRLTLWLAYAESDATGENPTWSRIGYPGPRHDDAAVDSPLPLAHARNGERVRADVVVIGSGAGGGVISSAFARAGKRVVVVEAGGAYGTRRFTQREMMMSELYLDGGLTSSHDLGVVILAGATVGGGTTVNWCTSLRLPQPIAAEWSQQSGIAALGDELAPFYDAVEERLGITTIGRHNANNRVILDGARALGVHAAESPRNAAITCGDGCGYCGFGCRYANKRSTAATYLHDVAAAGGAIYANATALHILFDGDRAIGVAVRQRPAPDEVHDFAVAADLVVVCAGSLRTPGILARSGVNHPLLGRRLFLHPVAAAVAEFDDRIEPWSGPMQTAHSDAFNYRSGNYGAKVEVAPAHPGTAALALPWENRAQHATLMERLPNAATLFALTRDRDPGSIDLDDEAAIRYRLSSFDGKNLLAGLAGLFDLGFAAGAARMLTLHSHPIEVERARWTASYRKEFTERIARIGIAPNRQVLFSAHQMGTAAIGSDPKTSVVDPAGRVWGYTDLLVADASVFPQSSGVNPMWTIMAMAARIAEQNGGSAS